MTERAQLILDVGGVLLADLRPAFWRNVATRWDVRNLEEEFLAEFKQVFWSGKKPVDSLYSWIEEKVGISDVNSLKQEVAGTLQTLPAFFHLEELGETFDLHLLSNHRTEWIGKVFGQELRRFRSITISDTVGYCKPDPAIFEIVQAGIGKGANVYYVDDHEKNLRTAMALGWSTILADADGSWIETLTSSRDVATIASRGTAFS